MRFEDYLKVEYDITTTSFLVSALAIQPLVENEVEHGLHEKIVIKDDGVGFDTNKEIDVSKHIGLMNVKQRIETMCNGSLKIDSEIGMGMICENVIPKRIKNMVILAVDDEEYALQALVDAVKAVGSSSKCFGFVNIDEALRFAEKNHVDVAFLDIKLRGYTGLELSLKLKQLQPNLNIIFATGYNQYMHHAMKQRCSGYIIKPVNEEVKEELENLRYPVEIEKGHVYAQTLGAFELYVDGKSLKFESSRSKELLAYLCDRQGASVKTGDISVEMWE